MQSRWLYTLCFRIARMLVVSRPPSRRLPPPTVNDALTSLGTLEDTYLTGCLPAHTGKNNLTQRHK